MNQQQYLAFCRAELRRSKKWRQSKSGDFDSNWRRYIDLYQGKHYDRKNNVDQLTVNLIFSTINTMGPAVAINNPKFAVHPRNPESGPQAIITEEVLNYLWRTHHYQREFRLAILDWMLLGHGWLKAGYKATKPPETKPVEGDWDQFNPPEMDKLDEGIDDRENVPGNTESEMNLSIDEDRPYLERISPFDMFVDPDARHPKEARWFAQRTWRPVQDVQADDRYSATQRNRVSRVHVLPLGLRGRRRPPLRREARQGRYLVLRSHRVLRHQAQQGVDVRARRQQRRRQRSRVPHQAGRHSLRVRSPVRDAPQLRGARPLLPDR